MKYKGVIFDLLTALLDSWSLWGKVAGSDEVGLRWRQEYLKLTYAAGAYRAYEDVVGDATKEAELPIEWADKLLARWSEINPWPETNDLLAQLSTRIPMAVATNCSNTLGLEAADILKVKIPHIVTAEMAGFYKPHARPYEMAIEKLGLSPRDILFVAGSASDVPGANAVGLDVYWHNKMGLAPIIKGIKPIETSHSLLGVLKYF